MRNRQSRSSYGLYIIVDQTTTSTQEQAAGGVDAGAEDWETDWETDWEMEMEVLNWLEVGVDDRLDAEDALALA